MSKKNLRKEFIVKSGPYVTHAREYHNEEERKKVEELHKESIAASIAAGHKFACRQCDNETPLEKLGTLADDNYGICDNCAGRTKKGE